MSNKTPKSQIPNRETYSRMNFLYQASLLMSETNHVLGAYFGQQCQSIGRKAQLRISPDLKRDLCKRCALAQRPGITTDLGISQPISRRRRKRKEVENLDERVNIVMACRFCKYSRSFRINPDLNFWLENTASITEKITYDDTKDDKAKDDKQNVENKASLK